MATNAAVDELHCVLCCEDIVFSASGRCDHSICLKCCVKLRILRKEKDCPVCRTPLKEVIVSKGFKKWSEKSVSRKSHYGRRDFGIQHEEAESQGKVDEILQHSCPECAEVFKTFPLVKDHVRKTHVRFYCEICLRNLKLFTYERKCYTREELIRHRKVGDEDDRSYRGHPLCQFCEERFLDNDELLVHLRKTHFWCHLCEKDGSQEYYPEYKVLRKHFSEQHYLCEEGECIHDKFTSVFRSKIDYQAHRSQKHSDQLSKAEARQVRQLDVDIRYTSRQNDNAGVITDRDYPFPAGSTDISGRDMRVSKPMDGRNSGQGRNFGREKESDQRYRENQRGKDTRTLDHGISMDGRSSGQRKNYGRDKDNARDPRYREEQRRDGGRESPQNIPKKNKDTQRPPVNKRRAEGVNNDNDFNKPQSKTAEVDNMGNNDKQRNSKGEKESNTPPPSKIFTQARFADNVSEAVKSMPQYVHSNDQFPTLDGEIISNQEGCKKQTEVHEQNTAYKNRAAGNFPEEDFPRLGGDKSQNVLHQRLPTARKQNSDKKPPANKFVDDFPALTSHGTTSNKPNVKKSTTKNDWRGKEPTKTGTNSVPQSSNQIPAKDARKSEYSKQGYSKLADDFPELSSQTGGSRKEQLGEQETRFGQKGRNAQSSKNKPVLQTDDFPTLGSSDTLKVSMVNEQVTGCKSNTPEASLVNHHSKKKKQTVKPLPVSYQEDFPKLPNAPPGLCRPPPGLKWSAPPGITGSPQPEGEDPLKQKNQLVIEQVSRILYQRGQHFDDFKSLSGKYRTGSITAQMYYTECCRLLGDKDIHKVFRKLVDLLPDEEKQKELLVVYNDAKVAAKSKEPSEIYNGNFLKQTVPSNDDFPTLTGKNGKSLQTNTSKAWVRGK